MLKILIKTLGLTFYKQHAGLFIVVFYLLFGMIQGHDLINFHKALLFSICASPINLLLLFCIAITYSLKCIHFVKQNLTQQNYRFAHILGILSKQLQFSLWLKVYAFLLLPVLVYSGLILITLLKHGYFFSFFGALTGLFLIFGLLTTYTFRFTNFSFRPVKKWIRLPVLKFNKPFWSWPVFYLLNEQIIVLFICKLVSILAFKVILLVFADIGNDIRVYLTAILAVILSHAVLVLNLVRFDAVYSGFAKALPVGVLKRFCGWLLVFILLLLPEFVLLIVLTKCNILSLIYCSLFAVGGMLFMQMLVYFLKADMEKYMKYLLFFFFVAMLAILAGYYLIFSLLMLVFAWGIFSWRYNNTDWKEIS